MNKENIIDYVVQTPHNPNKKVLDDMLETLIEENGGGNTSVSEQIAEAIAKIPQNDWNQNDENAKDYIKNRPFYEEGTIIVPKRTIDIPINARTFEIQSDISIEEGPEYTIILDGEKYISIPFTEGEGDIISRIDYNGTTIYISSTNSSFRKDLLFWTAGDVLPFTGKHTIAVALGDYNLYQIDPKYIKDMYYEYIAPNNDVVLDAGFEVEEDYQWFDPDDFSLDNFLVEGATYRVNCNDETYICTARRNNDDEIYIGNQAVCDDEWLFPEIIESNEPFYLYTFEEDFDYGIKIQTAGEYNIVIVGTGEKLTVKTIDYKYIPNNIKDSIRKQWNEIGNLNGGLSDIGNEVNGIGNEVNGIRNEVNGINGKVTNKMDKTNPVGTGSFSMNRKSGTVIGNYSHAEGISATASGFASHAEGDNTTASGNYSHSEGHYTTASGESSHAEGDSTTASGQQSHAEGDGTVASGIGSHAEGGITDIVSLSLTYVSKCKYTVSAHNYAIKLGKVLNYGEMYAKILSYDKDTLTIKTAASLGTNLSNTNVNLLPGIAYGKYSHSEGCETTASGSHSHAEGDRTLASGEYSHAEGGNTTASGNYSHAECSGATASGHYSHAEGRYTTASGESSHAEGDSTIASGESSHAEGYDTNASGQYQHAQGKYNIKDTADKYAHIVGNGTSDTKRSNAHTLDWEGNAWFAGSVEGTALILLSPNGTRFNITVGDDGVLSATEMTE